MVLPNTLRADAMMEMKKIAAIKAAQRGNQNRPTYISSESDYIDYLSAVSYFSYMVQLMDSPKSKLVLWPHWEGGYG